MKTRCPFCGSDEGHGNERCWKLGLMTRPEIGFDAVVTRWTRRDGRAEWHRGFVSQDEAIDYAEACVNDGLDAGEKVVVYVWQTENGVRKTRFSESYRTN